MVSVVCVLEKQKGPLITEELAQLWFGLCCFWSTVLHTGGTVSLGNTGCWTVPLSAALLALLLLPAAVWELGSLQSVWVSCCSCPCFQKGECSHGLEGTCLPLQVQLGGVIPLSTYSVETSLPNSGF